jgi:iron complex outermembrane receptor protein
MSQRSLCPTLARAQDVGVLRRAEVVRLLKRAATSTSLAAALLTSMTNAVAAQAVDAGVGPATTAAVEDAGVEPPRVPLPEPQSDAAVVAPETGEPALAAPVEGTAEGDAAGELAATPAEPTTVEATTAEATPAESGEMVVSAQRYAQDVQKTPVTVNAFSTRGMEQRGVTNLQDLSKFTPNLQLQATNRPAGGGSAYAAYIRGIGTGDFQFPTDPGVGLYVDDIYIARTVGGLLSIDADLERIEVVKGPQGTLWGRNTIGGAFNITTAKPRLNGGTTASALVRLGTYGRKDFTVHVNTPLWDDHIGAKLSVATFHSDGYGERILTGEKTNSEERLVVRSGLLFKLTSALSLRVDGDYSHQDQKPPTGTMLSFEPNAMTTAKIDRFNNTAAPALNPGLGLPPGSVVDSRWISGDPYKSYALQPQHDRYDIGGASARFQYSPTSWLNVKSITGVRKVASDVAVDGDQTPYSLQSSKTKLDDTQFSQELQLSGDAWKDRFTYIVGLYFFREKGKSRLNTESFHGLYEASPDPKPPADGVDTLTRFGLTATSYALFTQESLEVLRGLHLTLGGRINRDQKDYDFSVAFTQRTGMQVPDSHAEAGWNSFLPKAGLDWSPVEQVMLFASYSQGFKSGGFSSSNQPSNPTPRYDPERVTAYEAGVKTHWFEGRRLTLNLTGFYNDYRDIQLTVQTADPMTNMNVRTTQNAGRAPIRGAEADVTAKPLPGLTLNGGLGYVHAKFDALSAGARSFGFKQGDRLPQIPDWSINGGVQYAFDVGLGELTVRGDVSYRGDQYMTPVDPHSHQDGYALYSARLSFVPLGMDQLELSVNGVNLSDQVYYIYRASLAPTGQQVAIAGQPRLVFAAAKYMY